MRDLILVPTFNRPEYLELCLERLAETKPGNADVEVWHDNRPRMAFPFKSRELADRYGAKFILGQAHWNIGNVTNFLDAYKSAFNNKENRYVYLVEDDVLVGRDFFHWHEAVQESGYWTGDAEDVEMTEWERSDYFCSVGWHDIRNPEFKANDDPHALVESAVDFSSIGVCWKREALAPVVEHATDAYYKELTAYLARRFPNSPIPAGKWTEQAGLIMRVLLDGKGSRVVCWPSVPRCAHIGVHGYHRVNGPRLTAKEIRELLHTGEFRKYIDRPDINTHVNQSPWIPEKLYVAQKF